MRGVGKEIKVDLRRVADENVKARPDMFPSGGGIPDTRYSCMRNSK